MRFVVSQTEITSGCRLIPRDIFTMPSQAHQHQMLSRIKYHVDAVLTLMGTEFIPPTVTTFHAFIPHR